MCQGKAVPAQAWTGPKGSRFQDNQHMKVIKLLAREYVNNWANGTDVYGRIERRINTEIVCDFSLRILLRSHRKLKKNTSSIHTKKMNLQYLLWV